MTLEFSTLTASAGRFSDGCETAVLDLRPVIRDNVLKNIPRYIWRWEDGHTTEILLEDNYELVDAVDACDFTEASREILSCTVPIPNQKEVLIGQSDVNFDQLMKKFCKAKSLVQYPTLFNADGTFNTGDPFAGMFADYLFAELKGPFAQRLRESAWTGDQDNLHWFEGILNQLGPSGTNWDTEDQRCERYQATVWDWATITAAAGATAAPGDVVDATSDAFIIQGETFDGLTGNNLVEMLVLWLERLREYDLTRWADEAIELELWLPNGAVKCIADLAACMQPCDGCVNPLSDPDIRARATQFRKDKEIWLYPYDELPIKLRTTPSLVDRMIFLPKYIGGNPTIAWVFRDQNMEQLIAEGKMPFYGMQNGQPDDIAPYNGEVGQGALAPGEFEDAAISFHIQRDHNCVDFWLKAATAVVVQAKNMWLDIQNVSCATLTPQTIDQSMSLAIDSCVETDTDTLALTGTALDGLTTFVDVGDTWMVYWDNGSSLIGTVTIYDDGTDTLTLQFALDVDCDLSATPVATITQITPLAEV